jgi:hypothetical protein
MGKNRVKKEDFSKFSTGEIPVSTGPAGPVPALTPTEELTQTEHTCFKSTMFIFFLIVNEIYSRLNLLSSNGCVNQCIDYPSDILCFFYYMYLMKDNKSKQHNYVQSREIPRNQSKEFLFKFNVRIGRC